MAAGVGGKRQHSVQEGSGGKTERNPGWAYRAKEPGAVSELHVLSDKVCDLLIESSKENRAHHHSHVVANTCQQTQSTARENLSLVASLSLARKSALVYTHTHTNTHTHTLFS
jgi:hypothetical protein